MNVVTELESVERTVAEAVSREVGAGGREVHGIVSRAFVEALGRPGAPGREEARYLVVRLGRGEPLLEQAYRAMAERMPDLVKALRRRIEEKDIEALLDVFAPAPPADDPRKAIALDNAMARARFLEEVPCLAGKEVAGLAGHRAANASVTASRWKRAGKVFSVPRLGEELYPAFQFRDGLPHPTVARALAELPGRKSPWQVAFWFTSSNGWLDGDAPADRLDDAEAVVEAARREAEDIVG